MPEDRLNRRVEKLPVISSIRADVDELMGRKIEAGKKRAKAKVRKRVVEEIEKVPSGSQILAQLDQKYRTQRERLTELEKAFKKVKQGEMTQAEFDHLLKSSQLYQDPQDYAVLKEALKEQGEGLEGLANDYTAFKQTAEQYMAQHQAVDDSRLTALETSQASQNNKLTELKKAFEEFKQGKITQAEFDHLLKSSQLYQAPQDYDKLREALKEQGEGLEGLAQEQTNLKEAQVELLKAFEEFANDYTAFKQTAEQYMAQPQAVDDSRLTALETSQTSQDNKLTSLENKQTNQDAQLTDLEAKITPLEAFANLSRDNEVDIIKNRVMNDLTEPDADIDQAVKSRVDNQLKGRDAKYDTLTNQAKVSAQHAETHSRLARNANFWSKYGLKAAAVLTTGIAAATYLAAVYAGSTKRTLEEASKEFSKPITHTKVVEQTKQIPSEELKQLQSRLAGLEKSAETRDIAEIIEETLSQGDEPNKKLCKQIPPIAQPYNELELTYGKEGLIIKADGITFYQVRGIVPCGKGKEFNDRFFLQLGKTEPWIAFRKFKEHRFDKPVDLNGDKIPDLVDSDSCNYISEKKDKNSIVYRPRKNHQVARRR